MKLIKFIIFFCLLIVNSIMLPVRSESSVQQEFYCFSKCKLIVEMGDITKQNADVIVNPANQELAGGGGACGAIFTAAGWDKLQADCNEYPAQGSVRCPTGQARVTDSFDLKKQGNKYIIHAVGPDCRIIKDAKLQDELLNNAYINSLKLADSLKATSISFPCISSGIYGFLKDRAIVRAFWSLHEFLKLNKNSHIKSVCFVVNSQQDFDVFIKIFRRITRFCEITI
jgi:O-acetyl-ADP-ribose deacetylase (regulator of RNase III)